jgi:hypothetical protein
MTIVKGSDNKKILTKSGTEMTKALQKTAFQIIIIKFKSLNGFKG